MRARRGRTGGPGAATVRGVSEPDVHPDHPRSPRAQELRRAYALHLAEVFGGADAAAGPDGLPPAASFDPGGDDDLAAPGGAFWVARLDGEPVGCVGVRTLAGPLVLPGSPLVGAVELKRLFTRPAARGHGVGRALLAAAEAWAAGRGAAAVALDTDAALVAAGRLYRAAGYRAVEAYNTNPYAGVWMAKPLPDRAG